MEAIVEVHSYIMFFLCEVEPPVMVVLTPVLWFLYRRGWWWTSLGGFILLVGVRLINLEVLTWSFGAATVVLILRFSGWPSCFTTRGVGILVGIFSTEFALAATENEEELTPPAGGPPEWQRNGYPSEVAFEEAVEERVRLLWGLIIAGAVFILAVALLFFFWGGAPPSYPDVNGLLNTPPREISPAVLQARPPPGTSTAAVQAVRAYARFTLRRY